jgi:uncharacterized protein
MTRVHSRVEETVRFVVDGLRLEGAWATCEGAARAVVLCHPHPQYGGTMDDRVVLRLARALAAAGAATLRFNFRGVGGSEGRHEGGEGEVADARGAVALAHERLPRAEITLAGYSFGALIALQAAAGSTPVARVVAVAPPLAFVDPVRVKASPMPILFVVGERDPYCPRADLGAAVAPRPVVIVPGADHFFGGQETALTAPVVDFVAGKAPV